MIWGAEISKISIKNSTAQKDFARDDFLGNLLILLD